MSAHRDVIQVRPIKESRRRPVKDIGARVGPKVKEAFTSVATSALYSTLNAARKLDKNRREGHGGYG